MRTSLCNTLRHAGGYKIAVLLRNPYPHLISMCAWIKAWRDVLQGSRIWTKLVPQSKETLKGRHPHFAANLPFTSNRYFVAESQSRTEYDTAFLLRPMPDTETMSSQVSLIVAAINKVHQTIPVEHCVGSPPIVESFLGRQAPSRLDRIARNCAAYYILLQKSHCLVCGIAERVPSDGKKLEQWKGYSDEL